MTDSDAPRASAATADNTGITHIDPLTYSENTSRRIISASAVAMATKQQRPATSHVWPACAMAPLEEQLQVLPLPGTGRVWLVGGDLHCGCGRGVANTRRRSAV
jgi:hypothetical protein